jgi:hypothetical protein
MLSSFVVWARQFEDTQGTKGVEAQVTESEMSANPSSRLDIDTPTTVARITCWESGDYDMEVIDLETERMLYSSHGTLREGKPFPEQFAPFFEMLGIVAK